MTVFFPKNHDWQGMGEQGEIGVGRYTAQKDSFPQFHIFDRNQFPAHLVTFTKEILNGKLHFFVQCSIPNYGNC